MPVSDLTSPTDTEVDSPMLNASWNQPTPNGIFVQNSDRREARLEAAETSRYLLANTYFHCREFDRCTAVFMPDTLPKGSIPDPPTSSKGKPPKTSNPVSVEECSGYLGLSQKALFLALYAKYLSGEKRKDESSEQILGPSDSAAAINRELVVINRTLAARFDEQREAGIQGQGWLEYLYGIVLAKGKSEVEARKWLLESVTKYPFNWGAWQELESLIGTADQVCDQEIVSRPR